MLKINEETRDKIVSFISSISVPVSAASNFLGIIQVLTNLEKLEEKSLIDETKAEE